MKLIDLLVKELPKRGGWPANISYIAQDEESATWGFRYKPEKDSDDEWMDFSDSGYEIRIGYIGDADDCNTSVVSRKQYESALEASEGWINWYGGECPVDSDAIVEVKCRHPSSYQFNNDRAGDFDWAYTGRSSDIIAYRLHDQGINHRTNDDRLEQDLNECIGQGVAAEWDGEGLPPVGVECEYSLNSGRTWFKCKIDYILGTQGLVMLADVFEGGQWVSFHEYDGKLKFRPLRTEEEKAREKLAASLHVAACASPIELNGIGPLYFKLADAIISGSVFGTTFKAGK